MMLGLIGISMPVYWLGEVMNLLTQSRMHDTWLFSWVPPLGYKPLSSDPAGWFLTLVIPWITLATLYMGLYGRVLRANLVEAGQEDYIRTARAKGLSETRILAPPCAPHLADHVRHAVRPRFRRPRRRRRPADRGRVRAAGRRQADLRRAAESRPAGHHGDGDVRLVLRRHGERRWSTCSMSCSIRASGQHASPEACSRSAV